MSGPITAIPAVAIPHALQRDRYGIPYFCIETPQGLINVEVGRCRELWCTGTPDAVIAYGLTRPEWLPGYQGNNPTSQRVVFEAGGPRLIIGKATGKRPKKQTRIVVEAWGFYKRTVRVRIPMTPEQLAFVEAMPNEDDDITDTPSTTPVARPVPQYRIEGNVIFLASISRAARAPQ
jgi:hypothetical protein